MAVLEGSSKMDDNFTYLESENTELDNEFFSFLMKTKENFSKLSLGEDEDKEDDDPDLQFMRFIAQMKQDPSANFKESSLPYHESSLPCHGSSLINKERNVEPFSVKCSSPSQKKRSHSSTISDDQENENIDPIERSNPVSKDASFNIFDVETKTTADFLKKRKAYAYQLFHYFNRKVFNNRLESDTQIVWSDLLRRTAGKAHCKRRGGVHSVHIELASKILTSFDRLRDTLLHEMCHAAAWIVNKKSCGHGPLWQTWASRCKLILPQIDLPKRCHNYEIAYKYTYKCSKCHFKVGRHSKSVKIEQAVCPYCYSQFVLFKS